jgi:ATP-dependent DNA ligase
VIVIVTARGRSHCGVLAVRRRVPFQRSTPSMSRGDKRLASQAAKSGPSRGDVRLPLFVPPQLTQPVDKPLAGPQWLHEIKLNGYRVAARVDNGRVQLLTRTGLAWTDNYPSVIAALPNLNVKTAYLDGGTLWR